MKKNGRLIGDTGVFFLNIENFFVLKAQTCQFCPSLLLSKHASAINIIIDTVLKPFMEAEYISLVIDKLSLYERWCMSGNNHSMLYTAIRVGRIPSFKEKTLPFFLILDILLVAGMNDDLC